MKHIGILGGTFNPIHNGHLLLAETARDLLALDEVWFLPSGCSYMKDPSKILPGRLRAKLVEAAIADHPAFLLNTMELERTGNTYTWETLTQLHEKYPSHQFYFIMGADNLYQIQHWREAAKIFKLATIVVAVRDNHSVGELEEKAKELQQSFGGDIRFLPSLDIPISATLVRERCKKGQSVRYLVPEAVRTQLENGNLYR